MLKSLENVQKIILLRIEMENTKVFNLHLRRITWQYFSYLNDAIEPKAVRTFLPTTISNSIRMKNHRQQKGKNPINRNKIL
jgi:hypothetical protein